MGDATIPFDSNPDFLDPGYRVLANSLPICLLLKDRLGRLIFANTALLTMDGITLADILGKSDSELFPAELASIYQSDNVDVMNTGKVLHGVQARQTVDGKRRWVERIKGPLRDENDQIVGVQILFWDVTRRKEAEDALAHERYLLNTLLENIPDAIYFKDRESRFIRVSKGLVEKSGKVTAEQIIGKQDNDIFTVEHAMQAREDEIRIMETGESIVNQIEQETWGDRKVTWCSTTKLPLRDPQGTIVGTFGISRDVTELQQSKDQLRDARDLAFAASQAKSNFVANISHEIRTPMNGIIGMADLLADTNLDQDQREYLGMIQHSSASLMVLLNDVLDFSKIEAGKLELDFIPFDLSDCVGKTTRTLAARAAEKGLELACRISPELPERLIGDAGRIRQIVVNLVGNAIKFTDQGEVLVDVTTQSRTDTTIVLHFSVRDTGIGIPANKQQLIFDAFSQADTSTTRRFGGTGLGLAITTQLVQMMKGQIWVNSTVGVGTTFHFTAELEIAEEQPPARRFQTDSLQRVPTLIVDDNATNRRILEEMLKSWQLKPVLADGGVAAVHEMQRAAEAGQPYRLVLLDCMMPGMDGFSVAELVFANPKLERPTIIMISSAGWADSVRCREIGIVHHMTKPVIKSELFRAIVDSQDQVAVSDPVGPAVAKPSVKPLRLLVVEDDLINQKVAAGFLEQAGHHVSIVVNGQEALQALDEACFDIVFMDIQMPVMDGMQATTLIQERETQSGDHVTIIAMTAAAMKGDRERFLAAGMDGYISKPIDAKILFDTIDELTGSVGLVNSPDSIVEREAVLTTLKNTPSESLINFQAAQLSVPGGVGTLRELASLFLTECPRLIEELKQGLLDGNLEVVRRSAHTVHGSSRILHAQALAEITRNMETAARQGGNHAQEHMDELSLIADQTCASIREWLGKN